MNDPRFHPACLLFPLLPESELEELAEDIRQNGLLNAITLLDGQILDGRNRLEACRIVGEKPRFKKWHGKGSPIEWAISQNLVRRHLTPSQRAVVALGVLPMLEAEAKERQRLSPGRGKKVRNKLRTFSGDASQIAAKITKTNAQYVKAAKAIQAKAPEIIEEIRNGRLNILEAVKISRLSKMARTKVLKMCISSNVKLKHLIRQVELDEFKQSDCGMHVEHGGQVQVKCGDSLPLMKGMDGNSVSVVVTSPPYNKGLGYLSYKDRRDDYLEWLGIVFCELKRLLRRDGSLFLNVGSTPLQPWNAMRVAEVAAQFFALQNHIIWAKAVSIEGRSRGHLQPIPGNRFLTHNFEHIFHFTRTGDVPLDRLAIGVPYEDDFNLIRNRTGSSFRCAGNVWYIPHETVRGSRKKSFHPGVFPAELAERCIKLHGLQKGMLVLDPFCGIGNSMVAASRLGVAGIGIDIDATYCREARKRVQAANRSTLRFRVSSNSSMTQKLKPVAINRRRPSRCPARS